MGALLAQKQDYGMLGRSTQDGPVNYQNTPNDKVSIFRDQQFRGPYKILYAQSYPRLHGMGWGDKIDSIKIPQGMRVTVYKDEGFSGGSQTFTSDVDLSSTRWHDQISSIRVSGQPVKQDQPSGGNDSAGSTGGQNSGTSNNSAGSSAGQGGSPAGSNNDASSGSSGGSDEGSGGSGGQATKNKNTMTYVAIGAGTLILLGTAIALT